MLAAATHQLGNKRHIRVFTKKNENKKLNENMTTNSLSLSFKVNDEESRTLAQQYLDENKQRGRPDRLKTHLKIEIGAFDRKNQPAFATANNDNDTPRERRRRQREESDSSGSDDEDNDDSRDFEGDDAETRQEEQRLNGKQEAFHIELLKSMKHPSEAIIFSKSPGTIKSYVANKKMVVSRTSHRTQQKFLYTINGLADFFTDPYVAEDIASSTCECIISAFRYSYFAEYGRDLHEDNRRYLYTLVKARKNIVPDTGRITGAVTRARTLEFLNFIDSKSEEELPATKKQLFKDVATTLYACGLRVFQLRALCRGSFVNDKNNSNLWVGVPKKGDQLNFEQKIVDRDAESRDFTTRMKEIIARRGAGKQNLDALFTTKEFNAATQKQFADLCTEASTVLQWPSGQHFHGTHMFRHGAIQDAFAEGGLLLAKLRGGHESEKCMKIYAASDAERHVKLQQQQAGNAKKLLEQAKTTVLRAAEARARELGNKREIDCEVFESNVDIATRLEKAEKEQREQYKQQLARVRELNESLRERVGDNSCDFTKDWNFETQNTNTNSRSLTADEVRAIFREEIAAIVNTTTRPAQTVNHNNNSNKNKQRGQQEEPKIKLNSVETMQFQRGTKSLEEILANRGYKNDGNNWVAMTDEDVVERELQQLREARERAERIMKLNR